MKSYFIIIYFLFISCLTEKVEKTDFPYNEITISELNNSNTKGAHELSFAYKLPCRFKGKSYETINCPTF